MSHACIVERHGGIQELFRLHATRHERHAQACKGKVSNTVIQGVTVSAQHMQHGMFAEVEAHCPLIAATCLPLPLPGTSPASTSLLLFTDWRGQPRCTESMSI